MDQKITQALSIFQKTLLQGDLVHRVFAHRGFPHRGILNDVQISHIAVLFHTSRIFFYPSGPNCHVTPIYHYSKIPANMVL